MPQICKPVRVEVDDSPFATALFHFEEHKTGPVRTVPAVDVVEYKDMEVDGLRLKVAVSKKAGIIMIKSQALANFEI